MPQGSKPENELFIAASCDRLRFRLPDPVSSPAGLANAGCPPWRGLRFFHGLGEEGGGPIYPPGSRLCAGPQRRTASPKPPPPIDTCFLSSMGKIQAQSLKTDVEYVAAAPEDEVNRRFERGVCKELFAIRSADAIGKTIRKIES
jgi:hypothetical protein